MAVVPDDFLEFAKDISLDREIGVRNATSRAYYAMYNHASVRFGRQCKAERGISEKGSHQRMSAYLKDYAFTSDDNVGVEAALLARSLTKIKHMRHHADYHLDERMPQPQAEFAIAEAGKFISLLNQVSKA